MIQKILKLNFLKSIKFWLILILVVASFLRLYRLGYPKAYVFDEVYHAFTAKEYLNGSKAAWEWWTSPPPGVAYEWTHPPIAKEVMAGSMYVLHTTDSWAWRLPGALLGLLSIYLVFNLANLLFKNQKIALFSAFTFAFEGLNFVQSRTGMNDIYLVTFMLACLTFFFSKKYFLSAIFLGLALASKWTGIYLLGFILILLAFKDWPNKLRIISNFAISILSLGLILSPFVAISVFKMSNLEGNAGNFAWIQLSGLIILFVASLIISKFRIWGYFLLIPALIYMASYIPFFYLGHDINTFEGLQEQMWWYHTGLKAHHDYASAWWSWPLNLYPVWYFVEYNKDLTISNIFASGNPSVFWLGAISVLIALKDTLFQAFKTLHGSVSEITKKLTQLDLDIRGLLICLLGFFVFWLPWAISPRIMFLYHYSPSIPFLSIILGYQINRIWEESYTRKWAIFIVIYILFGFILTFPILTGIPLQKDILELFFRTNLTKNPFG